MIYATVLTQLKFSGSKTEWNMYVFHLAEVNETFQIYVKWTKWKFISEGVSRHHAIILKNAYILL